MSADDVRCPCDEFFVEDNYCVACGNGRWKHHMAMGERGPAVPAGEDGHGVLLARVLARLLARSVEHERFNVREHYDDVVNGILEDAPESWDGDEGGGSIAVRYVARLVAEVQRLGGCMRPWCQWEDNEPCDHGYLPDPLLNDGDR
jgi:hypothetical protein